MTNFGFFSFSLKVMVLDIFYDLEEIKIYEIWLAFSIFDRNFISLAHHLLIATNNFIWHEIVRIWLDSIFAAFSKVTSAHLDRAWSSIVAVISVYLDRSFCPRWRRRRRRPKWSLMLEVGNNYLPFISVPLRLPVLPCGSSTTVVGVG